jgi:hypothetical protein
MNAIAKFDVDNAFDRSVLEPRIVGIRKKVLFAENEQPNAVRRNIQYFSF